MAFWSAAGGDVRSGAGPEPPTKPPAAALSTGFFRGRPPACFRFLGRPTGMLQTRATVGIVRFESHGRKPEETLAEPSMTFRETASLFLLLIQRARHNPWAFLSGFVAPSRSRIFLCLAISPHCAFSAVNRNVSMCFWCAYTSKIYIFFASENIFESFLKMFSGCRKTIDPFR